MIPIDVYWIGWWTHRWWPHAAALRGLVTGKQPDGQRVPRRCWWSQIGLDLRRFRWPTRPWQAESTAPPALARRAFTRRGAIRRAYRLWMRSKRRTDQ